MRNESLFTNVENVYSFDTEKEEYSLKSIDFKKSKKLINLLRRLHTLETQNKIKVITRGFSFRDNDNNFSQREHSDFITYGLDKFFVVGQKSAHYLNEQLSEVKELYNYNMVDRTKLVEEIIDLYGEANRLLARRGQRISPTFIEFKTDILIEQLQGKKFFLIAFLHNMGRVWEGKLSSPLLSFSYGRKKKETARKFATNSLRGGGPTNEGFIILGYVPIEGMNFENLTGDMNDRLEEFDVKWYENIHSEIMLLDGIMPHRIIGLFEVKMDTKENFILNPWLGKMFSEDVDFKYRKGVDINQNGFEEYAKSLNYSAYVLETVEGRYNKLIEDTQYYTIPEIHRFD